jgi:hypothetical protein
VVAFNTVLVLIKPIISKSHNLTNYQESDIQGLGMRPLLECHLELLTPLIYFYLWCWRSVFEKHFQRSQCNIFGREDQSHALFPAGQSKVLVIFTNNFM